MKSKLLCAVCLLLLGCGTAQKGLLVSDRKIPLGDITEFYYTVENINFNAYYLRYRFYIEDGSYYLYCEERKRPDDYGPTTEEDITFSGTAGLKDEEWEEVFGILQDGKVNKRGQSADAGSSGPWTYIYWKGDKGTIQEYSFSSYEKRAEFESWCEEKSGR